MSSRRYELRVARWLSDHTRGAFSDLAVVHDLGLRVVSLHGVPDCGAGQGRGSSVLASSSTPRRRAFSTASLRELTPSLP